MHSWHPWSIHNKHFHICLQTYRHPCSAHVNERIIVKSTQDATGTNKTIVTMQHARARAHTHTHTHTHNITVSHNLTGISGVHVYIREKQFHTILQAFLSPVIYTRHVHLTRFHISVLSFHMLNVDYSSAGIYGVRNMHMETDSHNFIEISGIFYLYMLNSFIQLYSCTDIYRVLDLYTIFTCISGVLDLYMLRSM